MKRAKPRLWMLMGLAAVGALAGYGAARLGLEFLLPSGAKWIKVVTLVAVLPGWLLVVAWHELGHVVGGWLTGGRFLLFVVGPFKWQRTPAGLRFDWNRQINLAGGLAACLPSDDRDLPRRIAVMIAGGPVASLLLAGLAVVASAVAAERDAVLAQHLSMVIAGLSGLVFLVTVFPSQAAGFKSDGWRYFALRRGDDRSLQEAALLSLTVRGMAGVRPAELPPEVLAAALRLEDGSVNTLYAHVTAFHHFADRGRVAEAQRHLDRVVAGEAALPPFIGDLVRADYAWLLAAFGGVGASAAARAWLDSAGACEFDRATKHRAAAAVALAEGKRDEALREVEAGLEALEKHSLTPVKNPFVLESLHHVRRLASA